MLSGDPREDERPTGSEHPRHLAGVVPAARDGQRVEAPVIDRSLEACRREVEVESVPNPYVDRETLGSGPFLRRAHRPGREIDPMALESASGQVQYVGAGTAPEVDHRTVRTKELLGHGLHDGGTRPRLEPWKGSVRFLRIDRFPEQPVLWGTTFLRHGFHR